MAVHILSFCSDEMLLYTRNAVLRQAGYEVAGACDVEQVLAMLKRFRFDLLVLGSSVSIECKMRLARGLRLRKPELKLLVVCPDNESVFQCYKHEFCAVEGLEGPEALLKAVESCMKTSRCRDLKKLPKAAGA